MEISKGNSIYTGVKETEKGEIVCEECGNDKVKTIMHADGTDFYMYQYECCKCENIITVKTKRTGINKKYWED